MCLVCVPLPMLLSRAHKLLIKLCTTTEITIFFCTKWTRFNMLLLIYALCKYTYNIYYNIKKETTKWRPNQTQYIYTSRITCERYYVFIMLSRRCSKRAAVIYFDSPFLLSWEPFMCIETCIVVISIVRSRCTITIPIRKPLNITV